MNTLERLEEAVERASGRSLDYLRGTPMCQIRRDIEIESGKDTRINGADTKYLHFLGISVRIFY